jgi:hypothetical protein
MIVQIEITQKVIMIELVSEKKKMKALILELERRLIIHEHEII